MARSHYTLSGVHWVWLGAERNASDSEVFYWKDETELNFTNWREGCPDKRQGENCVLMTIFRDRPSHWCNFKCDSNYDHVMCQKPWTNESSSEPSIDFSVTTSRPQLIPFSRRRTPVIRVMPTVAEPPDECDFGWDFKGNKCYKFIGQNVTGEEAKYYCLRYGSGSSSLSIHSEAEQTWAVDFAFYKNEAKEAVWLGALRSPQDKSLIVWKDGSPMDYENWSEHEPDNRNKSENCVAMNDNSKFFGRWIDAPCSLKFHLICQKKARIPLSTVHPFVIREGSASNSGSINSVWSDNLQSSAEGTQQSGISKGTMVFLIFVIIALKLIAISLGIMLYQQRKQIRRGITASKVNIYYNHSQDEDPQYEDPMYEGTSSTSSFTVPPPIVPSSSSSAYAGSSSYSSSAFSSKSGGTNSNNKKKEMP